MKIRILILALAGCFACASISFGQINATAVFVDARYFFVENEYLHNNLTQYDISKDSILTYFSYYVGSNLSNKEKVISFQSNYKQNQGGIFTIHSQTIRIELDTNIHQIYSLSIGQSDELHFSPIDTVNYWNRNTSGIGFTNVLYSTSFNGDTIKVRLNAEQLRELKQLNALGISQYTEASGTRSYTKLEGTKILSIPDSAYIYVNIIGHFPLLNAKSLENRNVSTQINISSKSLTIFVLRSNENLPLPCYDILGRKHDLEFLGSDENSSTYSLRSLRAGVYFVYDGKETVKFMIGE